MRCSAIFSRRPAGTSNGGSRRDARLKRPTTRRRAGGGGGAWEGGNSEGGGGVGGDGRWEKKNCRDENLWIFSRENVLDQVTQRRRDNSFCVLRGFFNRMQKWVEVILSLISR